MNVIGKLRNMVQPPEEPRQGIYHYRREFGGKMMRLHLRIESDGSGILVINASGVLHLNPTAIFLMKMILDGKTRPDAISAVRGVYRAGVQDVVADYEKILSIIDDLDKEEDSCPVWKLGVDDVAPFEKEVFAPYRADLALNYECNNKCIHCYVPRKPGEKKSLSVDQWKDVLGRLWESGVPHICFTGGEATMYPHLVELIERAEDLGQITGLLTNGRLLSNRDFVKELCVAGLDHVQVTLESHDPAIHDQMVGAPGAHAETVQGIRNAIDDDVYLLTNTTVCALNYDSIEKTIEFIAGLGLKQFAMNSFIQTGSAPSSGEGLDESQLEELIARITCAADDAGLRFIWYTPTQYCQFNPASHGVGLKRCTAAEYNICIEPDGDVIPCQSYYEAVGNILSDPWDSIWNSDLFKSIRTRSNAPDACLPCPDFDLCGAGCPLSKGDRFLCKDSTS
jgi:radical SAM protein with 4Fe4S-binding SPASM domain